MKKPSWDCGFIEGLSLREDVTPHLDKYPFTIPALANFNELVLDPKVTFFVGENGSGKSTLLEAIAVATGFSAEGGSKQHRFKTHDTHSHLWDYLRLHRGLDKEGDGFFLRAETLYNTATYLRESGPGPSRYGDLHSRSHGESFLDVLMALRGHGLYIFDEPEAALSPQRQMSMLARMHELVKDSSQFIIATHSPILMAYPEATILHFSEEGIQPIAYEDTEHYQITRSFLGNRDRYLKILFES